MVELKVGDTIKFRYRNYKGETSTRTARIEHFMYGNTEWHPEGQWLLTCWDYDKNAFRSFAMRDMREVEVIG